MELSVALEIVRTLIEGTDPTTGERLGHNSPFNHPNVIRALLTLVEYVKEPRRKKTPEERRQENIARGLPSDTGLPWDEAARIAVAEGFQQGLTVEELAKRHSRTTNGLAAELMRQGLISTQEAMELGLVVPRFGVPRASSAA